MRQLFAEARVRPLSVFWCGLIIGGLFASDWVRPLSSIGVAGLFLTGVGYALTHRGTPRAQSPLLLLLLLVFGVHLATGLLHAPLTHPELGRDLLLESPFVLLPAAFWLLPAWRPAHLRLLWLLLLGCCLVSAAASTGYYLLHQRQIEELYLHSQVMPTAPDHIRFSLLVSMAVAAGLVLLVVGRLPRWLWWSTLGTVALLFLFLHLLAVRSGLVTVYGAGALWLGWLGWHTGRWRTALLSGVGALALGGASLVLFPTLQNKITNTRTDAARLDVANDPKWYNYSITARYYSYQIAYTLIREHPLLGVSKVRLEDAMAEQYAYQYPAIAREHYLLPHNQFIFNLAAYGVLGLLASLLGFYALLWRGLRRRKVLLVLVYAIVTASFAVEYTLETQIGVITGLFFLLLADAPVEEQRELPPASKRRPPNTAAAPVEE